MPPERFRVTLWLRERSIFLPSPEPGRKPESAFPRSKRSAGVPRSFRSFAGGLPSTGRGHRNRIATCKHIGHHKKKGKSNNCPGRNAPARSLNAMVHGNPVCRFIVTEAPPIIPLGCSAPAVYRHERLASQRQIGAILPQCSKRRRRDSKIVQLIPGVGWREANDHSFIPAAEIGPLWDARTQDASAQGPRYWG